MRSTDRPTGIEKLAQQFIVEQFVTEKSKMHCILTFEQLEELLVGFIRRKEEWERSPMGGGSRTDR